MSKAAYLRDVRESEATGERRVKALRQLDNLFDRDPVCDGLAEHVDVDMDGIIHIDLSDLTVEQVEAILKAAVAAGVEE